MMRWLLGLLLLANLGLFLWGQTRLVSKQPQSQKITLPAGVQEILLLREIGQQGTSDAVFELKYEESPDTGSPQLPDHGEEMVQEIQPLESAGGQESSETKSRTVAVEAVAEPVCGRVGPYADADAAEKIRDKSQYSGISMDMVETTERVKKGYWVLIPTLPSRQEAKQMVEKLKAAGVTDLWLFNKGPLKNAISLGMYAEINNATRRFNDINEKGFDSEVSPKMSEQTRYWLEYRTEDKQALADWVGGLSGDLQNEKKACE